MYIEIPRRGLIVNPLRGIITRNYGLPIDIYRLRRRFFRKIYQGNVFTDSLTKRH